MSRQTLVRNLRIGDMAESADGDAVKITAIRRAWGNSVFLDIDGRRDGVYHKDDIVFIVDQ